MAGVNQSSANSLKSVNELIAYIDGIMATLEKYPMFNLSVPVSISGSVNVFAFLMMLLKKFFTQEELIDALVKMLIKTLPVMELAVKGVILSNLKLSTSCNVDPYIPNNWRQGDRVTTDPISTGANEDPTLIPVSTIDIWNIFQINPTSQYGQKYYAKSSITYQDKDAETRANEAVNKKKEENKEKKLTEREEKRIKEKTIADYTSDSYDILLTKMYQTYGQGYDSNNIVNIGDISTPYQLVRADDMNSFLWFVMHKSLFDSLTRCDAALFDTNNEDNKIGYATSVAQFPEDDGYQPININDEANTKNLYLPGDIVSTKWDDINSTNYLMCVTGEKIVDDTSKEILYKSSLFPCTNRYNSYIWYKTDGNIFTRGFNDGKENEDPAMNRNQRGLCNIAYTDGNGNINPTPSNNGYFRLRVLPKPMMHYRKGFWLTKTENINFPFIGKKILFNNEGVPINQDENFKKEKKGYFTVRPELFNNDGDSSSTLNELQNSFSLTFSPNEIIKTLKEYEIEDYDSISPYSKLFIKTSDIFNLSEGANVYIGYKTKNCINGELLSKTILTKEDNYIDISDWVKSFYDGGTIVLQAERTEKYKDLAWAYGTLTITEATLCAYKVNSPFRKVNGVEVCYYRLLDNNGNVGDYILNIQSDQSYDISKDGSPGGLSEKDKLEFVNSYLFPCYPGLTIYEFNWDFVMNTRLFYPKVVAQRLLETLLSFQVGVDLSITMEESMYQMRIAKIIEDLMETVSEPTGEIKDCFFEFSNSQFTSMLQDAEKKRANLYPFEDDSRGAVKVEPNDILNILNQFDETATLQEQSEVLTRTFTEAAVAITDEVLPEDHLDIGSNLIMEALKAFGMICLEVLLSPKMLLLFEVNWRMSMGEFESVVDTVKGFKKENIKDTLQTLLIKFSSLITSIIAELMKTIIEELTTMIMKKISELTEKLASMLILEQITAYRELIFKLIDACSFSFPLFGHRANLNSSLDVVTYADIDPVEQPQTEEC